MSLLTVTFGRLTLEIPESEYLVKSLHAAIKAKNAITDITEHDKAKQIGVKTWRDNSASYKKCLHYAFIIRESNCTNLGKI